MNWKFSTITVIRERLPPPCLSSQESYLSRPWMKIGLPLVKYWLISSPVLPNAEQSTKVTSSRCSPLCDLNLRLQAMPNSATAVWLGRYLSCGSRVRFPRRITWLKLAMRALQSEKTIHCANDNGSSGPSHDQRNTGKP